MLQELGGALGIAAAVAVFAAVGSYLADVFADGFGAAMASPRASPPSASASRWPCPTDTATPRPWTRAEQPDDSARRRRQHAR